MARRVTLAAGVVLLTLVAATVVGLDAFGGSSPKAVQALPSASQGSTTAGRGVGASAVGVPGLTAPGIHVRAVVGVSGELNVVENVVFSGTATGLDLTLPSVKGVAASARPGGDEILDLRVTADGTLRDTKSLRLDVGGRLALPWAPRTVELRYRLVGTVMQSRPSTAGRALVVLPPIATGDELRLLPVVVEIQGAGVRNVICPGLASENQLCGRQDGDVWRTVVLHLGSTAVLAQVDVSTG